MVILIDTNVAINYLTNRTDDNSIASARLMSLCAEKNVEGYIVDHSDFVQKIKLESPPNP